MEVDTCFSIFWQWSSLSINFNNDGLNDFKRSSSSRWISNAANISTITISRDQIHRRRQFNQSKKLLSAIGSVTACSGRCALCGVCSRKLAMQHEVVNRSRESEWMAFVRDAYNLHTQLRQTNYLWSAWCAECVSWRSSPVARSQSIHTLIVCLSVCVRSSKNIPDTAYTFVWCVSVRAIPCTRTKDIRTHLDATGGVAKYLEVGVIKRKRRRNIRIYSLPFSYSANIKC